MCKFIEDENLSRAWGRAVRPMIGRGAVKEIAPCCVSITGFDNGVAREDPRIRSVLDASLLEEKRQNCHTVANTIFPESMWNPSAPRSALFARYALALPRMKRASTKNRALLKQV